MSNVVAIALNERQPSLPYVQPHSNCGQLYLQLPQSFLFILWLSNNLLFNFLDVFVAFVEYHFDADYNLRRVGVVGVVVQIQISNSSS